MMDSSILAKAFVGFVIMGVFLFLFIPLFNLIFIFPAVFVATKKTNMKGKWFALAPIINMFLILKLGNRPVWTQILTVFWLVLGVLALAFYPIVLSLIIMFLSLILLMIGVHSSEFIVIFSKIILTLPLLIGFSFVAWGMGGINKRQNRSPWLGFLLFFPFINIFYFYFTLFSKFPNELKKEKVIV